jgi:uncharacterized membrane protein YhaH (DUF805 family)
MTFIAAVKKCLNNYAKFSGRAGRSEFWWFFLFNWLVQAVAAIIDFALFGTSEWDGPMSLITTLGLLIPQLAVGARRLHDRNLSGWWQLVGIVPILGWILLIVWLILNGQDEENRFGPPPVSVGTALYAGPSPTG